MCSFYALSLFFLFLYPLVVDYARDCTCIYTPLHNSMCLLGVDQETVHHWDKHVCSVRDDHHTRLGEGRIEVVEMEDFVVRGQTHEDWGATILTSTEQWETAGDLCVMCRNIMSTPGFLAPPTPPPPPPPHPESGFAPP